LITADIHAFTKVIQNETIGETIGEEMAMMDVYGLNQCSQSGSFIVQHDMWSYIIRHRVELALTVILVTISEDEPDCPRCFTLRTQDQNWLVTFPRTAYFSS
jgi:hypothetical protein